MSNNSGKGASSFDSKSCYRLYAGHSNWINLNAKTTQDLLKIFQKGEPCRYQLEPGLFIDIIPNDVDCNSKNIDMIGLMRADLVYDSQQQQSEAQVQQQMSHYVRSLLDEQGIIDAFPPLRKGEKLPIITSLPTHRHLSLVPSVVGAVRRGPKSSASSSLQTTNDSKNPSSTSSINEESYGIPSSSSSTTQTSSYNRKKTNNTRTAKRARQTDCDKRQLITLGSPNMVNTSFMAHCSPNMLHLKSLDDSQQPQYQSTVPFHFSHHQHQQTDHSNDSSFWTTTTTSGYQHPSLYSRTPHNLSFESMDLSFDHSNNNTNNSALQHQQRHSPTDILVNSGHHHHGFPFHGQATTNEHGMAATIGENMQLMQTNNKQSHFVSNSDTNSLESFVPASPIPNWLDKSKHEESRWMVGTKENEDNNDNQYFNTTTTTDNMTTLPVIERLVLQQDTMNTNNILFSHANREESSHSITNSP